MAYPKKPFVPAPIMTPVSTPSSPGTVGPDPGKDDGRRQAPGGSKVPPPAPAKY